MTEARETNLRGIASLRPLTELTGDSVVDEAIRRFQMANEWESTARQRFLEDIKFRNGDSDNGYQWPGNVRAARSGDAKPCLTINIIRQHNLQISNRAKENKSSVRFVGTGNQATAESAEVIRDIMRRIEYQSNAQTKYSTAREFQIDGGIGFWRLYTDYAGDDTFDQEIFIGGVDDPLSVFIDPNAKERDGSDADFAFVYDILPEEEFYNLYPRYRETITETPLGISIGGASWVPKDRIMICEYFRRVPKKDELVSFISEDGTRKTLKKSMMPKEVYEALKADPLVKRRTIVEKVVEWYLIAGTTIIDSTIWPGKYIPIIRVLGERTVIDGIMDYRGHTRWMKDTQRMYNYNASAQVEFVAMQSKTPYIAPIEAISEYSSMWNTANITTHSVLPYKHIDDQGNAIPPPVRQDPPNASPAFQAGMETAFNQMMMVSGQYQSQMGMMGNERTGAAIQGRQKQGDTATYHFEDYYEEALVYTGRQILDLLPKIYDTKRIFRILADDGTDLEITIDPMAQQAYTAKLDAEGRVIGKIFNPNIGVYDVIPSAGPAYGTRREETAQALTLILTQAPALVPVIGDMLLRAMDFEGAQEAAIRLKRMVPPQALGGGPSAEVQGLQQRVQSLQVSLAKALEQAAQAQTKLVGKSQMRNIDVYKAETDRISALKDFLPTDAEGLRLLINDVVKEAIENNLASILEANANNLDVDGPGLPNSGGAM